MIIDSHTHAFPAAAVADPARWAEARGERHWLRLVTPAPGRASLQGWVNEEVFLSTMDRDGISRSVLLGWYWEEPATCAIHNEEMAGWIEKRPDRFSALAAVHPRGPAPREMVAYARERGFPGFGELLPAIQGSSLADPFWNELAALSAEAGLVFNFHVTEPVGRPHPGRVATPFEDFHRFICAHPDLTIILSHWGGGLFLSELNPFVRRQFANVYYDTSASPLLYDSTIFPIADRAVGSEKLLFGSDYPLRLYPRKDRAPGWSRFLGEIAEAELTAEARDHLLGGNAKVVFGI